MKIISYCVVEAYTLLNLTEAVNLKLFSGWQPFGGLIIRETGGRNVFSQVMVEYANL